MRPWRRSASTSVSAEMGLYPHRRLVGVVDEDGLDRAGGSRLLHPVTLCLVEARGEQQRFLAVEGEDVRGEKDALCEPLVPVEIYDKPHLEHALCQAAVASGSAVLALGSHDRRACPLSRAPFGAGLQGEGARASLTS
ncbi:hypothetical protein ADK77_04760 [Streptomyces antibioticus]|nr:hypothetical protein ADK77_04760 [Streptomyces antibioticus]